MNQFVSLAVYNGVPLDTLGFGADSSDYCHSYCFFQAGYWNQSFWDLYPRYYHLRFSRHQSDQIRHYYFYHSYCCGNCNPFHLEASTPLYLPRVAIMITIVGFAILALLIIGGIYNRTGLASVIASSLSSS